MDYLLTEDQKMIQELCRQIAVEKIKPVAAEYDEKNEFAWDIIKVLADADICGVYIPEDFVVVAPLVQLFLYLVSRSQHHVVLVQNFLEEVLQEAMSHVNVEMLY